MKFKFILFTIVASLVMIHGIAAQKLGHINSALIIQVHPKVALANTQLEEYQKSLTAPFEAKAIEFQNKYKSYMEQAAAGTLSQVMAQAKEAELKMQQDSLSTEEQQIQFKILQKREQLLQPILSEVDVIIQTIGKEGGYTMIFDTSVAGALLFATETEDLTEAVKARLKP